MKLEFGLTLEKTNSCIKSSRSTQPHFTQTKAAVTFTLSCCLEFLVTSEEQDEEKGLDTLQRDVYQREEKHGSNDLGGKCHLKNDRAQLDVLTTCFHGNGPAASTKRSFTSY